MLTNAADLPLEVRDEPTTSLAANLMARSGNPVSKSDVPRLGIPRLNKKSSD